MTPIRHLPHEPVPGSVRPADITRLVRLGTRLADRWRRRRRRLMAWWAVAATSLGTAMWLGIGVYTTATSQLAARGERMFVLAVLSAGLVGFSVFAFWRVDRTRRRARGSRIRLRQVQRRLTALGPSSDGERPRRPLA